MEIHENRDLIEQLRKILARHLKRAQKHAIFQQAHLILERQLNTRDFLSRKTSMVSFQDLAHNLIYGHAILGGVTLVAGFVAAVTDKGGSLHRRSGSIFVYALIASIGLALLQIIARKNFFLALLSPFVIYMALSGWLAVSKFELRKKAKFERILAGLPFATGLGLIGYGIYKLGSGLSVYGFAGVYLGLGALSVRVAYKDWCAANTSKPQNALAKHVPSMLGAYTAAVTAFVAVNFHTETYSPLLVWLVPPAIGVAGISLWMRKLKLR